MAPPLRGVADLLVVGLSHHTAPVEVREKLAFPDGELEPALLRAASLARGVEGAGGEAMIISTCNRVELYLAAPAASHGGSVRADVARFLDGERRFGGAQEIDRHLYDLAGEAAVRHLFRVAASLDSAVVGEPQILGQLKDAYELAVRAGTVGPVLGHVVPRAFSAAKRVRTETGIARSSASVASAAVELGRHIFGDLAGREVLVIGAGKMGELAARHLVAAGCERLLVVNRTEARGESLAARLRDEAGARTEAHAWDALPQLLVRADVVLSSTGAAEPVLTREMIQRAMKARRGRWLCLLDIAVPRDIEPAAGQIENVYLYDVDALTQVVGDNLAERRREAEEADRIVAEELAKCRESVRALGVVPAIRALRDRFAQVAQAEARRALAKMPSLDEKQRREVQLLADGIVNKLLHAPLTALKRESESEALVAAVRTLFELPDFAVVASQPQGAESTESGAREDAGPATVAAAGGNDKAG